MPVRIAGNPWAVPLLLTCLYLPLLFSGLRNEHNWGGDFAMYILHAENLLSETPYAETGYAYGYAYRDDVECFGPESYPPGFPLALAPVVKLWGLDMRPMLVQQNVILLALGLILYAGLRDRSGTVTAALAMAVLWTSPWLLAFKANVLSDLFFTMLLLACWLVLERYDVATLGKRCLVVALISLLVLTRSTGWVVPLALLLFCGLMVPAGGRLRLEMPAGKPGLIMGLTGISVCLVLLIERVLSGGTEEGYFSGMSLGKLPGIVLANTDSYLSAWVEFFPSLKAWDAPGQILAWTVLVFAAVGYVRSLRALSWFDVMVPGYLLLILIWPCYQGFRFILPILPFVVIYSLGGISALPNANVWVRTVFIAWLGLNLAALLLRPEPAPGPVEGPYRTQAREMFQAVQELTPAESQVDFFKPRVMALYGRRASGYPKPEGARESTAHFVVSKDGRPEISSAVAVWQNERFILWSLNSGDSGSE